MIRQLKAVPTPWRVCDDHPQRACIYIKPEDGWREVAVLYGGFDDHEVKDENGAWQNDTVRMANAAFIVTAVNHFDDLTACVRAALNMTDGDGLPPDWDFLRRTLKSAEAKDA